MYHIELLKMAMPCECVLCLMFAIHLIEVWQETLRAKFKTINCSAFPSIFDCTTINYSVFTRFACIRVENNNHENVSAKHRSVLNDAIVDWWRWGRVEYKEQFLHWSMVKNQRCRPNGHCVSVQAAIAVAAEESHRFWVVFFLVIS